MASIERLRRLAAAARESNKIHTADLEVRDAEIEALDRDGVGIREIARAAGLTPSHTQRIVVKQTAARQAAL
ncbi:MAG TPA: hypothetical protein VFE14_20905 [Micromonosporaceae bacterium]|jgi:hypothetical protein|nr:hypothetical protein [Micromonosporaceae bacterium]